MITLIRFELLRIARDRRFWFWSLFGVPVLVPLSIVLLGFLVASSGTVKPTEIRPIVAVDQASLQLREGLEGVGFEILTPDDVEESIVLGNATVGIVDLQIDPDLPIEATLLFSGQGYQLPAYQTVESYLRELSSQRREQLIENLNFDGPSFDILLKPIELQNRRVRDRLPSGLTQLTVLLWSSLLVFPYLLYSWNSGSRATQDRESGYLSPLTSSTLPNYQWILARWAALTTLAGGLLVFSTLLLVLYISAYSVTAEWLVSNGILEGLSDASSRSVASYLVGVPEMWHKTSVLDLILVFFLAGIQLAATCAIVLWASLKSTSLAQYRLLELLPFALVFFLPLMALGMSGTESSTPFWIPGLNVVVMIQAILLQSMDGLSVFLSTLAVLISNASLALVFIALTVYLFRGEKVWSSL